MTDGWDWGAPCPRGDGCLTIDVRHHDTTLGLEAHIRRNGTTHYARRCIDGLIEFGCGRISKWLPHTYVERICDPSTLPVITHLTRPCEHTDCDSAYSELHHIYPQHIDREEAARYPIVALCRTHHARWHRDVEGRTM